MDKQITILIADDHSLFRKGIISMLQDVQCLSFVGEAGSGEELVRKYVQLRPDVLLVDITMSPLSGPDAVKRLMSSGYRVKALFLSMHSSAEHKLHCYYAGGLGLVGKDAQKSELISALQAVHFGNLFFGREWTEETIPALAEKYKGTYNHYLCQVKYESLSAREQKVARLIAEGYTSKEIAKIINRGKRTVDSIRSELLKKLNVSSVPELISITVKNNSQ